MNHEDLRNHIDLRIDKLDGKIDRLDRKLDSHLERISRAEEAIIWMKGHIRMTILIGTSAVGSLAAALWKYILP